MSILDDLIDRVLGGRIDAAVREHEARAPHVDPEDALTQMLVHGDRARLHIDETAIVNNALFNLSAGEVTVGKFAFFGHGVCVLTGTHDVNKFGRERQQSHPTEGRDVVIEDGVWVSSNATVMGPCRIGAHAVVGACALVNEDVEPYTVVAGVPAKVVKKIEPPAS